ncbi:multicopper oxidase LPR2 isoform X1 [Elaeis guineensis]|uniref:Multicopper oxidase LPR2 isoform X1 n=1 Tax=Elaeis guineensis var. tenera TaxID=51953 RepID=A0A6I9RH79_ELAGV|nr:multicopper oxidase LPR2 isoform X1 [Elaeis guineensis]
MAAMGTALFFLMLVSLAVEGVWGGSDDGERPLSASTLEMFVDELPDMPRLRGYEVQDGVPVAGNLTIGMYEKTWKFHRDLPASRVFAFGTSKETATVPGPTIEGLQGVPTHVTWTNYLPSRHILPWDPTLSAPRPRTGGVPTVVHRHGGVHPPHSDGHSFAWFTSSFSSTGPKWSRPTFSYPNAQPPGSLWYHDHAMALTRVNLLAGLFGAYSLLAPALESPLRLPSGPQFDLPLVVFDRSFLSDGSIYMNSTGNNPDIHPQWQPEYFGDAIIVNGKAWPFLAVRRRRYRFRIINASNARFFRFFFTNGLRFVHVASDSVYLPRPVSSKKFLLAPSEIADVIVDFSQSANDSAILANDAPYPYPSGDPADEINGRVMKFVIGRQREVDSSRIPESLLRYPAPAVHQVAETRYIAMYEYESATGEPTRLYLNGKSFMEPATETPREGSSEVWHVINLTDDNHPLHIHLAVFVVLEQRELVDEDRFKDCMMKLNDAIKCRVEDHAIGKRYSVPRYERGWKNVFKMRPGCVTKILVRFSPLEPEMGTYPFNSTEEPGYVYHCHILDHEDNEMMRPLKLIP